MIHGLAAGVMTSAVTERRHHAWGATFDVPAPIENYDETIPLVEEITHGIPDGLIAHIASPSRLPSKQAKRDALHLKTKQEIAAKCNQQDRLGGAA